MTSSPRREQQQLSRVNIELEHASRVRTFLLIGGIPNNRIVDGHTLNVVIIAIICVDKGVRNVGHVEPSITFTGEIHTITVHVESIDETLVKSDKFKAELNLICDVWNSL